MTLPNPGPILDLIEAFRRSKTMSTALSMGIFDLLGGGAMDGRALAQATGADTDALERLLEACCSLSLLEKNETMFRNSPLAETYLQRTSPHSLAGYVQYSNDVLYPMWAHLDDAVREGTDRWQQTFQLSSGALFDRFYNSDESMGTFLMGMHGFGMLSSPAVANAFDLSRFDRVADLGGGTGHLVRAVCARFPGLTGMLFDLPRVISFARKMPGQGEIEFVAGDFFEDPLPAAGLYALGRILHDWSAARIERLLRKVVSALPPGGGLLIAEKLMDDDHAGPVHVHMQSLNMLICTEGRERSLAEFREILLGAGFQTVEGKRTGQPVDAILATKSL